LGLSKGYFSFKKSFLTTNKVLEFINYNDKPQNITLIGHSWGGYIAANKFYKLKNKNKLILLAPFNKFPNNDDLLSFSSSLQKEYNNILHNITAENIKSQITEIKEKYNIYENCKKIDGANVLIVQGSKDLEVPLSTTNILVTQFKIKPDFIILEDDHIFLENRPQLIQTIKEWLIKNDNFN
jgi:alpha/beta superfamily hydrolase